MKSLLLSKGIYLHHVDGSTTLVQEGSTYTTEYGHKLTIIEINHNGYVKFKLDCRPTISSAYNTDIWVRFL